GGSDAVEVLNAPQQRLTAMQDDREVDQRVFDDMLLDAPQQLLQHTFAHLLGLVIDGGVAKPVAIGAVDVASRRDLDQHLGDRLILENGNVPIVSQHATPRRVRENHAKITSRKIWDDNAFDRSGYRFAQR